MWKTIRRLSQNSFVHGGVFLMIANTVVGLMNYLFNVIAGRSLGPTGYGEITTLFAYLSFFSIPFTILNMLIVQKVGSAKVMSRERALYIERWFWHAGKTYFVFIIPILIASPFFPHLLKLEWYSSYSLIVMLFFSLLSVLYDGLLMGLQQFIIPSAITIGATLIKLAGAGLGFTHLDPMLMILLGLHISHGVKVVFSRRVFQRITVTAPKPRAIFAIPSMKQLIGNKKHLIVVASVITMTIFGSIDMIIVKQKFNPHDAGLYAAWTLLSRIIFYVLGPLLTIAYSYFLDTTSARWHRHVLCGALAVFSIGVFVVTIGYRMYDTALITMIFGRNYLPLKPFVTWSALYGSGIVAVTMMNNYYLAKLKQIVFILPISVIFYISGFMFLCKNIADAMYFSTIFVLVLFALYLIFFIVELVQTITDSVRLQKATS